jgi:hypothetical protein
MMLNIEMTIEQGLSADSNDHALLTVRMEFPGLVIDDLPDSIVGSILPEALDRVHEAARALSGSPVRVDPETTSVSLGSPA